MTSRANLMLSARVDDLRPLSSAVGVAEITSGLSWEVMTKDVVPGLMTESEKSLSGVVIAGAFALAVVGTMVVRLTSGPNIPQKVLLGAEVSMVGVGVDSGARSDVLIAKPTIKDIRANL